MAGVNNKVVARFADGRLLKGSTADFFPNKDHFHVIPGEGASGAAPIRVVIGELKALFFVRDLAGNPEHEERKEFAEGKTPAGRRIEVVFRDGERLVGTTTGYQPGRPGFFLVPADRESNTERCYVVAAAAEDIRFL